MIDARDYTDSETLKHAMEYEFNMSQIKYLKAKKSQYEYQKELVIQKCDSMIKYCDEQINKFIQDNKKYEDIVNYFEK